MQKFAAPLCRKDFPVPTIAVVNTPEDAKDESIRGDKMKQSNRMKTSSGCVPTHTERQTAKTPQNAPKRPIGGITIC